MANLIHCFLCLESFGAFGARVCPVLTLFMLLELVNIDPSMVTNTHTVRSLPEVANLSEHVGQRKLCFVS